MKTDILTFKNCRGGDIIEQGGAEYLVIHKGCKINDLGPLPINAFNCENGFPVHFDDDEEIYLIRKR